MPYKAAQRIQLQSAGGKIFREGQYVSRESIDARLFEAMIEEGVLVEVGGESLNPDNPMPAPTPAPVALEVEAIEPAVEALPDATDTALKLAEMGGIDLNEIEGSGQDGRIITQDVRAAIEARGGAA